MNWKITAEHEGMLIKEYLQQIQGFSRRILRSVKFGGGSILKNGQPVTVRQTLAAGDELAVVFPPEKRGSHLIGEDIPLDIVYEDEDILVLNKPAGIVTIPSMLHPTGTIANALIGYYERLGLTYTVHVVTRLDRDTSGLLLVAKHRFSHSLLFEKQKSGSVNRSYYALVEGELKTESATIDAPIAKKETSMIEREVIADGKHAVTHYQVIRHTAGGSLVDVRLETGRTHQIRVHFSHIGHPLMGDDLYGGHKDKIDRQALHCKTLTFQHPATGERLEFSAPMPDDMKELLDE
ncbi:RluA family pseudouridine synthase [Sediminibacillus halophilus]|uniref:Pseudouridine synthase n=1 Tax=Sediminibacillus halophilus TaxID=482461 RepID=A0A1G9PG55_9BACI|nr:RluA family pseudouridine synthase [Sediminibacillus halophilus]SDL97748.1 23S rRNA pseudouridine1911/1915/1917 synthase [Sediminibacillus halophilus]